MVSLSADRTIANGDLSAGLFLDSFPEACGDLGFLRIDRAWLLYTGLLPKKSSLTFAVFACR